MRTDPHCGAPNRVGRVLPTLVVPAAGKGSRLEGSTPKALVELHGRPLIEWVLAAARESVDSVVVVVQPQELTLFEDWAASGIGLPTPLTWVLQEVPEGSLKAVQLGVDRVQQLEQLGSGVIIAWADQVGLAPHTVDAVARGIATDDRVLVVPVSEAQSPYVWMDLDDMQRIQQVMRVRDGDASPSRGLADLGIFGLSESLALEFLSLSAGLEHDAESPRELDFTYLLTTLSAMSSRTLLPRIHGEEQLIAVNTPEDLARAKRILGGSK